MSAGKWASLKAEVECNLRQARRKWNRMIGSFYFYRDDNLRREIAALIEIRKYITKKMKPILLILILCLTAHAEAPCQHIYGPWFKQAQQFYIAEQPAHACKLCGVVQNAGGRFMELVKDGPTGAAGGMGTLTSEQAKAAVQREIMADFGSLDAYKAAKALEGGK